MTFRVIQFLLFSAAVMGHFFMIDNDFNSRMNEDIASSVVALQLAEMPEDQIKALRVLALNQQRNVDSVVSFIGLMCILGLSFAAFVLRMKNSKGGRELSSPTEH